MEMTIEEYIKGAEDKSNASESKSHLQMVTKFGSLAIKKFIMNNIVPSEGRWAHERGHIYIHDADHLGPYCNSIDPTIPLEGGLDLPTLKAHPAKHFGSALDHLYSYTMYSQNHFGGAQSLDWFNWFLAPYVVMDELSENEIKQELQKFFFNCNQITRTGGKPPFINCGIRFECPKPLQDRPVVWNGTEGLKTLFDKPMLYSDPNIVNAAKLIAHTMMDILEEGMYGGMPFTYPLIATSILPESDFNDPLWQRAFEVVAHNGSLYFVNLRPQYMQMDGGSCDIVSSQCCRVRVKFSKVGGIWSGGEMGTGSNRIITLNCAAMGIDARNVVDSLAADGEFDEGDDDYHMELNKELFHLASRRLTIIRKTGLALNQMVYDSIYTWNINGWLAKKTKSGIPYFDFSRRRLLVGVAFVHDMLVHMGYKDGLLDYEGNMLAQALVLHIQETLQRWMEEQPEVEWGLEAPPNESSNNYMVRRNIEVHGESNLSLHGNSKEDYEYAPATHVPYEADIGLPEKVMAEAPFHRLCNGGNILHVWMGEEHPDPQGIGELIERISNTDIGYFAISKTISICEHGCCSATGVKVTTCPKCGGQIVDYMDRITGYYEHVSRFNNSKSTEFTMRVRYGSGDMNDADGC